MSDVATVYGYARVSTREQDLTIQREALRAAGCTKVYAEKMSGADPIGRNLLGS
jgi:DNA invertase Pin-like site-specific DNA recombinase